MCTVTWAHRPDASGYDLGFNRDERLTRGAERAPEVTQRGGALVLAPTDGDGGGTWLAVNEHGLTVCLLNGYTESAGPPREEWTSRGVLVRRLADSLDAAALAARLGDEDLSSFRPFVLLGLGPGAPARVMRWDGLDLSASAVEDAQLLVSSGHDQPTAQRARAARYAELVAELGAEDPTLIERFLADHGDGPSAYSPCMHRADAETRSQCLVRVDAESVSLVYVPGAPCRTAPDAPRVLARRASATPA